MISTNPLEEDRQMEFQMNGFTILKFHEDLKRYTAPVDFNNLSSLTDIFGDIYASGSYCNTYKLEDSDLILKVFTEPPNKKTELLYELNNKINSLPTIYAYNDSSVQVVEFIEDSGYSNVSYKECYNIDNSLYIPLFEDLIKMHKLGLNINDVHMDNIHMRNGKLMLIDTSDHCEADLWEPDLIYELKKKDLHDIWHRLTKKHNISYMRHKSSMFVDKD